MITKILQRKNLVLKASLFFVAGSTLILLAWFVSQPKPYTINISDSQIFYPEIMYADTLITEPEADRVFEQRLLAGIGPHHLPLSAGLLKGFYGEIASQKTEIKTIVLLAPDHFDANPAAIAVGDVVYKTSLGQTRADSDLIKKMVEAGLVIQDKKAFVAEHGIWAHIPFVQQYLPQALIVPVLFGSQVQTRQAIELGDWLATDLGDDVMVIASLDLSHYQPRSLADMQDQDTIQILRSLNSTKIQDTYLDSPAAVWTLFQYLEVKRADTSQILYHANSAEFGGDPESTTGYVTMLYGK